MTRVPRSFSGERILFSTNNPGISEYLHTNNECGPLPHIIYKNELKWIKDPNVRDKTLKRKLYWGGVYSWCSK